MKDVSKLFIQEVQSLESGVNELEGVIRNCKDRITSNKAVRNLEIQKERIRWLKQGYRFCLKEINSQEKLKLI